ncbi:SRPBCC family protein [Streptomyces sp. NPDC058326]|uniref:SRPBCC family protein n=1 Tax=Streptomyces sp. NPDC058326 TaxID=3346447 RepID=UPI0036E348D2
MSRIEKTIDISRSPEDLFSYMMDPSHMPEWQESAVAARKLSDGPLDVGSRIHIKRRIGRREMPMTMEVMEMVPSRSWHLHGIDGPVRGDVQGTIEPLDDGRRSRLTLSIDFESHGIGKVLVPLVVKPHIRKEMPRNEEHLKELMESGAR